MKRLMFVFVTLIFVTSCLHAQSPSLVATIPFNFQVGNIALPPGTYTIRPVRGDILLFQSKDNPNDAVFVVPLASAGDINKHDSELIFRVSDGRFFLWQMWTEGYSDGREFAVKSSETLEANTAEPSVIVIKAVAITSHV